LCFLRGSQGPLFGQIQVYPLYAVYLCEKEDPEQKKN